VAIQDPSDLAREGRPSILVLLMIEETPVPWALDETRAFLARAVLRQNARNAAVLVQP
jgi:hypothetical protein